MKILIEHNGVKREINGPFTLCASRGDFEALVELLQWRLNDPNWTYGWVSVREEERSTPNLIPINWNAGA